MTSAPDIAANLAATRDAIDAAGPGGLGVDALPSPRAALVALTEAEARGLVVEPSSAPEPGSRGAIHARLTHTPARYARAWTS